MHDATRLIMAVFVLSSALSTSWAASPPTAEPTLTLEQRIEAQRAIDRVYWDHQLWPAENSTPKPSFELQLDEQRLRQRAEDALLFSRALELYWAHPVSESDVQAELDRIASATKDPTLLQELFAALDHDPVRIAETLARPLLVSRLIHNYFATDQRIHASARARAARQLAAQPGLSPADRVVEYRLRDDAIEDAEPDEALERHEISVNRWKDLIGTLAGAFDHPPSHCAYHCDSAILLAQLPRGVWSSLSERDDAFVSYSILQVAPDAVQFALRAWPKESFDLWWARVRPEVLSSQQAADDVPQRSSGRLGYRLPSIVEATCTPDSWQPTATFSPDRRDQHTAVWTGSEILIWGGMNRYYDSDTLATGMRYRPATDTWLPMPNGENAPSKRKWHTAIWTGREMIVWGGNNGSLDSGDGARFDPLTNSWRTIPATTQLTARARHTVVWTGVEMIVWGGTSLATGRLNSGARFNPATDSWAATSTGTSVPGIRYLHTAIWTGKEMVVWGGYNIGYLNTGGRYDAVSNSWRPTSLLSGVPEARQNHTAIWTGTEMIVWGGYGSTTLNSGARYNPVSDVWAATSVTGAVPAGRERHSAVWTGSEMIVWGGLSSFLPINTGGRYTPSTDGWAATSTGANCPLARDSHSAVWTGSEMIVWGGKGLSSVLSSGARYAPATDTWVPTASSGANPVARYWHSGVFTGTHFIVWAGFDDATELNSGSRYDLATDSWSATSQAANVPVPRRHHVAVWTGSRMLVWGGYKGAGLYDNGGGQYDPIADTWLGTSKGAGTPTGRVDATAVWSGSEMIVWGGYDLTHLNTGARYNPVSDSWIPTSTGTNVPLGRRYHTAVFSDSEMIVWGGNTSTSVTTNTGARYAPASDSWTPTTTGLNCPSTRSRHVGVWTGSEMIVWGGTANSSGGRYRPNTDSWLTTSTSPGVPAGRSHALAVWSGSEMIIWGGGTHLATGGRYDPIADRWIPTADTAFVPAERTYSAAAWTGSGTAQMIVWGGEPITSTGGLYCGTTCTPQIWYRDVDNDGFGGSLTTLSACTRPLGYAALSTDCNDGDASAYPGNTEWCDGKDNDCNLAIDNVVPPTQLPSLSVWRYATGTELSWPPVPGADGYDLVRGLVSNLHASAGDFTSSTSSCLANNTAARRAGDGAQPPAGDAVWYLARAVNCRGNGTYDSGFAAQQGLRDAEIAASAGACP